MLELYVAWGEQPLSEGVLYPPRMELEHPVVLELIGCQDIACEVFLVCCYLYQLIRADSEVSSYDLLN